MATIRAEKRLESRQTAVPISMINRVLRWPKDTILIRPRFRGTPLCRPITPNYLTYFEH